ncbi:MAG TPA: histidine kinase dimerization/phosphoacceptor domain -containing protein [Luteibaculaceae bacterium]|nr:histidine kinase dimerization/phosphoacceptor domain -containing protein [Luteibaculaceae bacterium]
MHRYLFLLLVSCLLLSNCQAPSVKPKLSVDLSENEDYKQLVGSIDDLISFQRVIGDTINQREAMQKLSQLEKMVSKSDVGKVDFHLRKGWLLTKINLLESFEQIRVAIKAAREAKSNKHIAEAYFTAGLLMEKEVDYITALQYYFVANNYFKLASEEQKLALCYSRIGNLLAVYIQYDKALVYLGDAAQIFKQIGDLNEYGKTAEKIISINLRAGKDSLANSEFDEMNKTLINTSNRKWLVLAYCSLADYYAISGATQNAEKCLAELEKLKVLVADAPLFIVSAELAHAKFFTQMGNLMAASQKLKIADSITQTAATSDEEWISVKENLNLAYYSYFLSNGEGAKANAYLEKYNDLSIQAQSNLNDKISAMVRVLEAEKDENYTISSLQILNEKQRQINEEQNTRLNYLIIFASFLAFLVGAVYYRYKQRKKIAIYLETEVEHRTQELKARAEEKSLMLKEIHHRVKNNLQLISSFLNLQKHYGINEKSTEEIIFETQERVRCMAIIHEKLYSAESLSKLDTAAYLSEIASFVHQSYSISSANIEVNLQIDSLHLSLDRMIPCGLIINELLSNCFKYAFKGLDKGEVWVRFTEVDGMKRLEIIDNGIGLPADFALDKLNSLGMNIVVGLVEQLDGKFEVQSEGGTHWVVNFA